MSTWKTHRNDTMKNYAIVVPSLCKFCKVSACLYGINIGMVREKKKRRPWEHGSSRVRVERPPNLSPKRPSPLVIATSIWLQAKEVVCSCLLLSFSVPPASFEVAMHLFVRGLHATGPCSSPSLASFFQLDLSSGPSAMFDFHRWRKRHGGRPSLESSHRPGRTTAVVPWSQEGHGGGLPNKLNER